MKPQITKNADLYRNATLGLYGHNILTDTTSVLDREYIAVRGCTDGATITYTKADTEFPTLGDATVTTLEVLKGETLILGPVKNITVVGTVLGYLIQKA